MRDDAAERIRSGVSRTRAARARRVAAALLAVGALGVTAAGCAGGPAPVLRQAAAGKPTVLPAVRAAAVASPTPTPRRAPQQAPPGIGPWLGSRIGTGTDQVVEVSGESANSPASTATLWQRVDGQWKGAGTWPTHNALYGWTTHHRLNDLRSPVGLFTLTDAGGLLRDPGSRMPYYHSGGFTIGGTGFGGTPLAGAFDYVIAINYNRVPGDSPLDSRRPDGWRDGGGIWLHVDHGGPTHGCVTLPPAGMVALLHALDPAQHPVVVMGDRADIAR